MGHRPKYERRVRRLSFAGMPDLRRTIRRVLRGAASDESDAGAGRVRRGRSAATSPTPPRASRASAPPATTDRWSWRPGRSIPENPFQALLTSRFEEAGLVPVGMDRLADLDDPVALPALAALRVRRRQRRPAPALAGARPAWRRRPRTTGRERVDGVPRRARRVPGGGRAHRLDRPQRPAPRHAVPGRGRGAATWRRGSRRRRPRPLRRARSRPPRPCTRSRPTRCCTSPTRPISASTRTTSRTRMRGGTYGLGRGRRRVRARRQSPAVQGSRRAARRVRVADRRAAGRAPSSPADRRDAECGPVDRGAPGAGPSPSRRRRRCAAHPGGGAVDPAPGQRRHRAAVSVVAELRRVVARAVVRPSGHRGRFTARLGDRRAGRLDHVRARRPRRPRSGATPRRSTS